MITKIPFLGRIINSIFTKLFLLTLATLLGVNLCIGILFWVYRAYIGHPFQQNVAQYLQYVVQDLGATPSLEKALQISHTTALQIHYSGPDNSWETISFPPLNQRRFHQVRTVKDMSIYRNHDNFIVKYNSPQGEFLFKFDDYANQQDDTLAHILFFLIPTIILTLTYLITRRILAPIRQLNMGVKQVAKGNLNHVVTIKRSDELGRLGNSFNSMTTNIREMIHAKERLLSDVSHELRSPLTRMKLGIEFLPEENQKELQTDIREMEGLVTSILDTARQRHGVQNLKKKKLDLNNLIRETIGTYNLPNSRIFFKAEKKSFISMIDQEKFVSVLKNVIDNSLKYSRHPDSPVSVKGYSEEGNNIISITDIGIGIESKDLPFIMEPFYRTDLSRSKNTGGYGLGLSLCKTIIEGHGGNIHITSTPGGGTTVNLSLPAA